MDPNSAAQLRLAIAASSESHGACGYALLGKSPFRHPILGLLKGMRFFWTLLRAPSYGLASGKATLPFTERVNGQC